MSHDHHDHSHEENQIPKFEVRDLIVREDIMSKAKELADLIYTSEEVKMYQQAEKTINTNERIQTLIASMKKKQKEIVAFERFQNASMVSKIEQEIDDLQEELDNIPIVSEFQQSQSDLNYLLQMIMTAIRDTVSEKLIVEEGKDVPASKCGE
ncbi:RicAFT regulatory complex protein RicA family protein [Paenibacillus guangzhouensis]|uniref:RicAFT regulatory complex protein RicA family protein n=1 Tax=Paenibacillus guangzhouensis TaxID=1473112 RepID=UPI001266DD12|nr:YlbF family regulator [Paenibacillus guangzhouensis]